MKSHGKGKLVSAERVDALEKELIKFLLNWQGNVRAGADFGCGFGRVSTIASILGYRVFLFDSLDLTEHFQQISNALSLEKLIFKQVNLEKLQRTDLQPISFALLQRVIHYLPHENAVNLLSLIYEKMVSGGKVFATISTPESEFAKSYPCANVPLEKRFCKIENEKDRLRFDVLSPVCLYSKKEAENLFSKAGFKKEHSEQSRFGNIKMIYYRP